MPAGGYYLTQVQSLLGRPRAPTDAPVEFAEDPADIATIGVDGAERTTQRPTLLYHRELARTAPRSHAGFVSRMVPLVLVMLMATCESPTASPARTPTQPTATPFASALPTTAPSHSPTPITVPTFVQVAAAGGGVVWILVQGERLFRSTDRGDTWTERSMPPLPAGNTIVAFISEGEGWFAQPASPATQCQAQPVVLWHTIDGAETWQRLAASGIAEVDCKDSLAFSNQSRGYLNAYSPNAAPRIYRTTDGGTNWVASAALPDPPGFTQAPGGFTLRAGPVAEFGSVLFVNATGPSGADLRGYVFRSTDSGATWSYVALVPAGAPVVFLTPSRWIELFTTGQSEETTDAGVHWHALDSDYAQVAALVPQVAFGDALTGYAAVSGSLQRTTDGGVHWTALHTPGTAVR